MSSTHGKLSNAGEGVACPFRWEGMVSSFCRVIPSTLQEMEALLAEIVQVLATLLCTPADTDSVELALREALANAILHGNQADRSKKVVVACFCDPGPQGGLLIVVSDEGAGFDPQRVPSPTAAETIYSGHGRGIFLMRQLMDDVQFRDNGRTVGLRKRGAP